MAMATTIMAGVSLATTAGSTIGSFIQAGKQKSLQRKAEQAAKDAMKVARKKLEVNFYDEMAVDMTPYELEREVNPNKDLVSGKNQDYSPGAFSNIALAGLSEVWADKHDWAKKAYNNSIAGLIYKGIYG